MANGDRVVRPQGSGLLASSLVIPLRSLIGALQPLTARDANARDLRQVLRHGLRSPVPAGAIPTSSQVPGPASDAAAFCSAASVQSVSPAPVSKGKQHAAVHAAVQPADRPGLGMGALARRGARHRPGA
jgi:hypothetical protein